jgi:hypothetical protein
MTDLRFRTKTKRYYYHLLKTSHHQHLHTLSHKYYVVNKFLTASKPLSKFFIMMFPKDVLSLAFVLLCVVAADADPRDIVKKQVGDINETTAPSMMNSELPGVADPFAPSAAPSAVADETSAPSVSRVPPTLAPSVVATSTTSAPSLLNAIPAPTTAPSTETSTPFDGNVTSTVSPTTPVVDVEDRPVGDDQETSGPTNATMTPTEDFEEDIQNNVTAPPTNHTPDEIDLDGDNLVTQAPTGAPVPTVAPTVLDSVAPSTETPTTVLTVAPVPTDIPIIAATETPSCSPFTPDSPIQPRTPHHQFMIDNVVRPTSSGLDASQNEVDVPPVEGCDEPTEEQQQELPVAEGPVQTSGFLPGQTRRQLRRRQ